MQLGIGSLQPRMYSECTPQRIRLRSKKTLRCRQDVEQGKMSILIQPKTFPLEGDSSLKIQRGKWWVKDASAIHEIPTLTVTKLPETLALQSASLSERQAACCLNVELSNPKDFEVMVAIHIAEDIIGEGVLDRGDRSLYASPPNGESGGPLVIHLGAFEDELLREEDEDSEDKSVTPGSFTPSISAATSRENNANEEVQASGDKADESHFGLLPWRHSVSHNIAKISIPLRVKEGCFIERLRAYDILLSLTLTSQDKTIIFPICLRFPTTP